MLVIKRFAPVLALLAVVALAACSDPGGSPAKHGSAPRKHPASAATGCGLVPEAALAKSCLIAIDVLRDDYGIAANDSRHPDVLSEVPWPPEAGQP